MALQTAREFLESRDEGGSPLERVVFCVFLEVDEKAYEDLLPVHFPHENAIHLPD